LLRENQRSKIRYAFLFIDLICSMKKKTGEQLRYQISKAKTTPLKLPKLPTRTLKKVREEKVKSLKRG